MLLRTLTLVGVTGFWTYICAHNWVREWYAVIARKWLLSQSDSKSFESVESRRKIEVTGFWTYICAHNWAQEWYAVVARKWLLSQSNSKRFESLGIERSRWQDSEPIFARIIRCESDMRWWRANDCCCFATPRASNPLADRANRKRMALPSSFHLVEMTGFEPATSTSRRRKEIYFWV